MPKQQEMDLAYMRLASGFATLSKAKRKKVGAVIVTPVGVCLPGYNGSPVGTDNELEYKDDCGNLITKPTTLHAELNCLLKSIGTGVIVKGSTLYVTLAPCEACAAMLVQVEIKEVVYVEDYRCKKGLTYLKEHGIVVRQMEIT